MPARTPRPWLMLAAAVLAQASTTLVVTTPAFLVPYLHEVEGVSLTEAGALAAAPSLGTAATLVLWGAAADRWGERIVLVTGLVSTAVAVGLAMLIIGAAAGSDFFFLGLVAAFVLIGCTGSSTNASSGRLIVGWFDVGRRGLAMGIRQTAPVIGIGAGAVVVPSMVAGGQLVLALGLSAALVALAALVCLVVVVDPVRRARAAGQAVENPYRRDRSLLRIHLVSMLLVIPQHTIIVFGLVWFIVGFGWSELAAGLLVGAAQLLGGLGRIGIGIVSDRLRSRLRPLRWVALAGAGTLLLTALTGWLGWEAPAAVAYLLATVAASGPNGLAYTAVAELAGGAWAGRALGLQNTGQFLTSIVAPPVTGALITALGYPAAFAIVALTPLIATPLVPPASVERMEPAPAASAASEPIAPYRSRSLFRRSRDRS